ncbi:large subunit ribosomal protein L4 [Rhodotorula toruloides]|uniref:Large ribosomal subunit protein uL4m n=1 Tax=Rhodotorula toruloides TaxID=5286 RepID=A0A0K3C9C1_RHOTO|nr:large subunit ribosomal protein L4 [Rhodotorula toruloides]PRQ77078.1 Ribosomal protein L4 domain-containing protein [Rhodotorula toruloides]
MSLLAATRRVLRPSAFASSSRAFATSVESTAPPAAAPVRRAVAKTSTPTPKPLTLPPAPTKTPKPSVFDEFVHVPLQTFYPQGASVQVGNEPLLVPLPATVFNIASRPTLLHKIIVAHRASLRQGTASTKNRSEVNYSGKKIRPQKGTGRARLGSRGSPMLVGGGRAFGPRPKGPNGWKLKINHKERQLGTRVALSEKWRAGKLAVIDKAGLEVPKTRLLHEQIVKREWEEALFIATAGQSDEARQAFVLAAQNIPGVKVVTDINKLSVYDIVKGKRVIMELDSVDDVIARADPLNPLLELDEYEDGEYEEISQEELEAFLAENGDILEQLQRGAVPGQLSA